MDSTIETQAPADGAAPKDAEAQPESKRLMSVDALRGFDMFWIIGAGSLVGALERMTDNSVVTFISYQLEHAEWAGFRFYDLIFPLFLFIVGVSLVFSLSKEIQRDGRKSALKRLFRRAALLFVVGLFYSGGFKNEWPDIRLLGVLQRLALGYFFGGLIFCFFRPRGRVVVAVSILVGYWALMTFVPIRDIQLDDEHLDLVVKQTGEHDIAVHFADTTDRVRGKYEPGLNLSNHLDYQYLPGKRYDKYWDPEGLLSTLPAIVTCLLGVFAGMLLRDKSVKDMRKVKLLAIGGVACLVVGYVWGMQFPIVKKIWTSSFVLVAGGWSFLLLAVFYLVIDVWKIRRWSLPFVWIGMNSITIYLTNNIIGYPGFQRVAERFAGGNVKSFINDSMMKGLGDLVVVLVGLGLSIVFVWYLHRRKIFLRL
ncbi:MAG: putative acyltransferase [Candidatus Binatia bacterium]|jgi:predicted acyltransferase